MDSDQALVCAQVLEEGDLGHRALARLRSADEATAAAVHPGWCEVQKQSCSNACWQRRALCISFSREHGKFVLPAVARRCLQGLTLVFVETKRGADELERFLCMNRLPATSIHGDRSQVGWDAGADDCVQVRHLRVRT